MSTVGLRMDALPVDHEPDVDWRNMRPQRWLGLDGLVHETYVMGGSVYGGNSWRDTLCGYEVASKALNKSVDVPVTDLPVTCLGCLARL